MLVEGIEEAVTEAPEEEQNSDETNGVDGFAQSQFSSPRAASIIGLERAPLEKLFEGHGGEVVDSLSPWKGRRDGCRLTVENTRVVVIK